jgi:regulator of sirC expression with transglutaminase-like and TPR domain
MPSPLSREDVIAVVAGRYPGFFATLSVEAPPSLALAAYVMEGLDGVDIACAERYCGFLAYLVERAAASEAPLDRMRALGLVLGDEEGYRGDTEDYDHPRNSSVSQVMGRRRGLPITLSVLYLSVAEHLGWPLVGIDFPGRFLVRYAQGDELLVADPFDGGRLLTFEACVELAQPFLGRLPQAHLRTQVRVRLDGLCGPRRIAQRMLGNLAGSFERRDDDDGLRNVLEKLLLLDTGPLGPWRSLGEVYARGGEAPLALACLHRYLDHAVQVEDRAAVHAIIARLERQAGEA